MTTKRLIWITVLWTLLTFGGGLAGVWYVQTHPIRGVKNEARAAKLGTGIATLTLVGYAVLWLPYAARLGQKRRAEREQQLKAKTRPRKKPPGNR